MLQTLPEPLPEPLIEARDLRKTYPDGTAGLRGIDLRVGPGELVGLMGPSGAGKTTLLRLLNGALRPDGGSLGVRGEDVSTLRREGLRESRRRVGVV